MAVLWEFRSQGGYSFPVSVEVDKGVKRSRGTVAAKACVPVHSGNAQLNAVAPFRLFLP